MGRRYSLAIETGLPVNVDGHEELATRKLDSGVQPLRAFLVKGTPTKRIGRAASMPEACLDYSSDTQASARHEPPCTPLLSRGFSICDLNTLDDSTLLHLHHQGAAHPKAHFGSLPDAATGLQPHGQPDEQPHMTLPLPLSVLLHSPCLSPILPLALPLGGLPFHIQPYPEDARSWPNSANPRKHTRRGSCALRFQCPRYVDHYSGINASGPI